MLHQSVSFDKGVAVAVDNKTDGTSVTGPMDVFNYLNTIAGLHGVGRVDLVENRFVGIKSRG